MKHLSLLLVFLAAPAAEAAAAQDVLEQAKAHYAAAAYEEALATLTRAQGVAPARRVELEQYRAFCFIALGKLTEAEQAVASLVAVDPKYVPSPKVASPKVLQLVSEMRSRELPAIVLKLFEDGRAAFTEKAFAEAQRRFDLLLELLKDPALEGRPETEDLRVLAEGFVALADASDEPPPAPPAPAPPPVPQETIIEPPVAVAQTLPEWIPPDKLAGAREYAGELKVIIGADGRVKSATVQKPTYPTYDAQLLEAARLWTYKPATRNGQPVESEKIIAIVLRRPD